MQSSWCAGNKIKVFISSKCDGRYAIVRKSLEVLLEESGMVNVYNFDSAPASSQNLKSSYLNKLQDSDVCIFLINNSDGVSEPVWDEHNHARQYNKPSLYIFCNENSTTETELQKSLRKNEKYMVKYKVVPNFSDLAKEAMRSLLYDFIDIYNEYSKGRLIHIGEVEKPNESDFISKVESISKSLPEDSTTSAQAISLYNLGKNSIKGFKRTVRVFTDFFIPRNDDYYEIKEEYREKEPDNYPVFDELCAQFFFALIGKIALPAGFFEKLKGEVIKMHHDEVAHLVILRIDAIAAYWIGNLQECINFLEKAHSKATEINTPAWLRSDILLDLRNMDYEMDRMAGTWKSSNQWQKALDKESDVFHYPALDRLALEISRKSCKIYTDKLTRNPYSTTYGIGYEMVAKQAAKIFLISVQHGSLTQILVTLEHLASVLSAYCGVHRTIPSMYKSLLVCLLLRQDEKALEKLFGNYFGYGGANAITANDAEELMCAVSLIPLAHNREKSYMLLLRFLGYQFSDEKFSELESIIKNILQDKMKLGKRNVIIHWSFNLALESLMHIAWRFDSDFIADFLMFLVKNVHIGSLTNYKNVFWKLEYARLSEGKLHQLTQGLINGYVNDLLKDDKRSITSLSEALKHIRLRKEAKDLYATIDEAVRCNAPKYFEENYSLDLLSKNQQERAPAYIDRLVDEVLKNNEHVRDTKVLSFGGFEPLSTIEKFKWRVRTNPYISRVLSIFACLHNLAQSPISMTKRGLKL
ncbi:MAG: hypothetical protein FWB76_00480 [Oscillospiraceae bacterium]|nr:hypothetical protein [Oscillospiraceae bacterium]